MFGLWRRRAKARNVLLWWGSFYRRDVLTIGDAHAVQNVSARLYAVGFEHCILSRSSWRFSSAPTVRSIRSLGQEPDSLIFVCGPLNEHPQLRELIDQYPKARKIAVGVSILPNCKDFTGRFDEVLPRDGTVDAAFDLAPARFRTSPLPPPPEGDWPVALCFVGQQGEYGDHRPSLHEQAEDLLSRSARRTGLPLTTLSTVLSSRRNDERQILEGFRASQVVATTRLHGSLYGLLYGRPVIALDQIPGRAKVSDVLGRIGWPLVFCADQADENLIDAAFETARSAGVRQQVESAREEVIARSEAALQKAVDLIVNGRC